MANQNISRLDSLKEIKARNKAVDDATSIFQARETVNSFYNKCPGIVENAMNNFAKLTGRQYQLFDYYGPEDKSDEWQKWAEARAPVVVVDVDHHGAELAVLAGEQAAGLVPLVTRLLQVAHHGHVIEMPEGVSVLLGHFDGGLGLHGSLRR